MKHFQPQSSRKPAAFLSLNKLSSVLALAAVVGASLPAQALASPANTGGSLISDGGDCNAPNDSYLGACTSDGDTLSGKQVVITDDVSGAVAGAWNSGNGTVAGNSVTVTGGTIGNDIYGGYGNLASGNSVSVSGGVHISNGIYGGFGASSGSASNNGVSISNATTNGVKGGHGHTATDNTVSIGSDATINGNVYGGDGDTALNNSVSISGDNTSINNDVYGGFASNASNNTVSINGSAIVTGDVYGGAGDFGSLTNGNSVSIGGNAVVNGKVYGGHGNYASNNTVSIGGNATINGDIYGGYGTAAGNRVILNDSPILVNSNLFGGTGGGTPTGNILEVRTTGLTAKNVMAFQEYHFILPADVTAGTTALTLTYGITDLRGTKIGVALASGGNVLKSGDRVTLIHSDIFLFTDPTIQRADMSGYQGVSLSYNFDVSADGNNLYATATGGATVMDQTKAPVEGRASTMALASQAGDLAGGAGMARAMAATDGASGTASFGATAGGSSRYNSGSHVDADGLGVMLGAAKRFPAATGQWMAGVFLEGGYGSYDTYNDFAGQPTVHGSGKSHYFGGGVLLRRDWAGAGQAGPYAEGALRVGQVSSDWGSRDMAGSGDASYDTSALYYGAHAGVGYILPLNDKTSIDAHVKGFWTHQNGDSVTLAGDPYEFKAMDSFRSRLGLRLNRALTEQVIAYVGAAWEHEFDGKARATTYGMDTPSPSLQGETGVFELGFDMKPKADGPLTVGLGAQAYTGMREGFGGTAKLMWVF